MLTLFTGARFAVVFGKGLVLVVLGALGFWGHKTHWHLAAVEGPASESTTPTASGLAATAPAVSTTPFDPLGLSSAPQHTPRTPPADLPREITLASAEAVDLLGIEVVAVSQQPMHHEVTAHGVVSYEQTRLAQLSSRVQGTVWRVMKEVGETVRAGDLLAIVDAQDVGRAKSELLRAVADVRLHEKIVERNRKLGTDIVSGKQVDLAETELRNARVNLFDAEQTLINLGLPVDPERLTGQSDDELVRYVKFIGIPDAISKELDPRTTTANLLPLFAPFDGLVIRRDIAQGEVVSSLDGRFEIADIRQMWITLHVREQDAGDVQLGQIVEFHGNHGDVQAKVSWISTEVDEKTRSVDVRCDADNPEILGDDGQPTGQRLLRANTFGTARIRIRDNPRATVVPTRAVQWDGTSHLVFKRISDRSFAPCRVRLGITDNRLAEILDGVAAGDEVAAGGSHSLKAEITQLRINESLTRR